MDKNGKQIVAVLVCVVLVVIAIYGSFLPYRKSRLYIQGSRAAQSADSLKAFSDAFAPGLDAASPIGQNELVRNVAGIVLNIVRGSGQNKELTAAVTAYLDSYYEPLIERGTGPSFSLDLYVLGLINESAFVRTGEPQYFAASEYYFTTGYQRGMKRPQFLYGLFDLYRLNGDKVNLKKVVDQILSQWPNDETIKTQYAKFLSATSTTPANISSTAPF